MLCGLILAGPTRCRMRRVAGKHPVYASKRPLQRACNAVYDETAAGGDSADHDRSGAPTHRTVLPAAVNAPDNRLIDTPIDPLIDPLVNAAVTPSIRAGIGSVFCVGKLGYAGGFGIGKLSESGGGRFVGGPSAGGAGCPTFSSAPSAPN